MRKYLAAIGAATLAGALAAPSAALGIPGGEGRIAAAGRAGAVPIAPGETVDVTLGIGNYGKVVMGGATVRVSVADDVRLPRTFDNCWYYTGDNVDVAWCELTERIENGTLVLTPFRVSAIPGARKVSPVVVEWSGHGHGRGGSLEDRATADAGSGSKVVRGSGGTLRLTEARGLTLGDTMTGYAHLTLVDPPPRKPPASHTPVSKPVPTVTPTQAGTPTRSTSPAPVTGPPANSPVVVESPTSRPPTTIAAVSGPDQTEPPATVADDALASTGSNITVVAGSGLALVLAGVLGLLAFRRRGV